MIMKYQSVEDYIIHAVIGFSNVLRIDNIDTKLWRKRLNGLFM